MTLDPEAHQVVTREDHQAALARAAALAPSPAEGLFGPGSLTWRVNREGLLFLAGGRAALLQTAHPFVAQAIADHSRTKQDLRGRFQRTFDHVFHMVFGDLDHALRSARRVHAVHAHIRGALPDAVGAWPRGQPYQANDPASLLWVFATLVDTSVLVHDLLIRPLTLADKHAL